MEIKTTPPQKLPELLADRSIIIDVRTPREFRAAHVIGAESVSLDTLDAKQLVAERGKETPIYILCQSGGRAKTAAEQLVKAGHTNVAVIEGGTDEAKKAGVPIEYGERSISIERQVRIAAGALVFAGTLLGIFTHSGFLAIPIFVGAGLVFAGVTNTCGMAIALGRCPWNQ